MELLHFIFTLLPPLVAMGKITEDVRKPIWPTMAANLCNQVNRCTYPSKLMRASSNHLAKTTGIKLSIHEGSFRLSVSQGLATTFKMCPLNVSSNTTRRTNSLEVFNGHAAKDAQHQKTRDFLLMRVFTLDLTPTITKQDCTILSMANSQTYPDVLYLLLHCQKIRVCSRLLHFLNLTTRGLMENTVRFCELGEGTQQIFTGPCAVGKVNCLYTVTLNSRRRLQITTYKEPETTKREILTDAVHLYDRFRAKRFLCSFYKPQRLLCLRDGSRLYHVYLNPKSMIVGMRKIKWHFSTFYGMMDFKINSNSGGNVAILVLRHSIVCVNLDFRKRRILKKMSVRIDAVTSAITADDILIHSKDVEEPFYKLILS